jgi:hypothetical protein
VRAGTAKNKKEEPNLDGGGKLSVHRLPGNVSSKSAPELRRFDLKGLSQSDDGQERYITLAAFHAGQVVPMKIGELRPREGAKAGSDCDVRVGIGVRAVGRGFLSLSYLSGLNFGSSTGTPVLVML